MQRYFNPGTASHPNGVHSRSQQLLKNNETFSICVKFVTKRTTQFHLNLGKRCVNSSDVSQLSLLSVCEMDLLALCEVLANKQLGQREGKKDASVHVESIFLFTLKCRSAV